MRRQDVEEWRVRWPASNVGVVLPIGVLCLDIDTGHDGKNGARTLAELERELGPLPPTVTSTARSDGSEHRFYLVDECIDRWPGKAGEHVDIIWYGNRYVVVAPSIHHTGKPYRWFHADGSAAIDGWLPKASDLADLPEPWAERYQAEAAVVTAYGGRVLADGEQLTGGECDIQLTQLLGVILRDGGEGSRNNRLHWAASRAADAMRHGMDPERAQAALVLAGIKVGLTEQAARATVASAYSKTWKRNS